MIGTIVSTVKSFYSASHYEWAAYERTGIGLSYLFGFAATLSLIIVIGITVAATYIGVDYGDMVMTEYGQTNMFLSFLSGLGDKIIMDFVFIAAVSFGLTMSLINLAIILAVIAMPLNVMLKADMEYDQLLRVTVYAIIPPIILSAAIIILGNVKNQASIDILFCIILALYEIFGIICAKRYLND